MLQSFGDRQFFRTSGVGAGVSLTPECAGRDFTKFSVNRNGFPAVCVDDRAKDVTLPVGNDE